MPANRRNPGAGQPGEFELIARLRDVLSGDSLDDRVILGIGDDCAVVRRGPATDLYTTDTLVDGVHFRSGQVDWFDLGWKALAVNLSDIAAMGGRPLYSIVTLGLPRDVSLDDIVDAYRGLAEAARRFGGAVIGGDVVRSDVLFISVSLIGACEATARGAAFTRGRLLAGSMTGSGMTSPYPSSASQIRYDRPHEVQEGDAAVMTRQAAVPGDLIGVTGALGCAAGGVRALRQGLTGADVEHLKRELAVPEPRLRAGETLAAHGVLAAMDVSDGLVADLDKLCEASAVAATIRASAVPVHAELKRAFPSDWREMALCGGEDYELIFTAPPPVMDAVVPALGVPVAVIGRIEPSREERGERVRVLDEAGRELKLASPGWDHLNA